MIFLHHCNFIQKSGASGAAAYDGLFNCMGNYAVTLFFMISGFFAYYTYKKKPFKEYITNKLKRIYPLLIILLLFSVASDVLGKGMSVFSASYAGKILVNALLLKSFIPFQNYYYSFSSHTWFLSVIFWFWILAYFLIPLLKRSDAWKKALYVVFAVSLAGSFAAAYFTDYNLNWLLYVNPVFNICVKCFAGIIAAIILRDSQLKNLNRLPATLYEIGAVVIFVLFFFIPGIDQSRMRFLLYLIPSAFLMFAFASDNGIISSALSIAPVQKLGGLSFEIYILHPYVINYSLMIIAAVSPALRGYADTYWYLTAALMFAVTVAASWIYSFVVSKIAKRGA